MTWKKISKSTMIKKQHAFDFLKYFFFEIMNDLQIFGMCYFTAECTFKNLHYVMDTWPKLLLFFDFISHSLHKWQHRLLTLDYDGIVFIVTKCNRRGTSLKSRILHLDVNQDLRLSTIYACACTYYGMCLRMMVQMDISFEN